MNTVQLIGRTVEDINLSRNNDLKIGKFRLAVQRNRGKEENKQDVDFIPCTALGKTADFLEKYVGKGQQIGVVGKLRINRYEKDGMTKTSTEVIVNEVYFAGEKKNLG